MRSARVGRHAEGEPVAEGQGGVPRRRRMAFIFPLSALCILALAGFLLFWKLGATSFHDGDEATYAQCAKEMMARGDYLNVHFRGEPFLEKPPVKIWLITLGYRLFGIGELGARLSSALFALSTVAITILLGRRLFGASLGLLAGLILISSTQFVHEHCGRAAEMEPETVFLYVASMACLWFARRDDRWFYAFAALVGTLAMTKGPLFAPILVIAALFLATDRPRVHIARRTAFLSTLVFLVIALPWHIHQLLVHGTLFLRLYLGEQIINRFLGIKHSVVPGAIVGITRQPAIRLYGSVVFHSLFPWGVLLLPALAYQVREVLRKRSGATRLLLIWIIVFALTIGFSKGKLPWYAIPMLPALALSIACFCRKMVAFQPRWLYFALMAAAFGLSLLFLPSHQYDPYSRRAMAWPSENPDVVTAWTMKPWVPLGLVPGFLTLLLICIAVWVGVGYRRAPAQGRLRTALWIALLCSFAFSSIYRTVLPLRGMEHRIPIAKCQDAVRKAGLHPKRAILLGHGPEESQSRATDYFYLDNLSGGNILAPERTGDLGADSVLQSGGSVVLADSQFGAALAEAGLGTPLLSEEGLTAFYFEGQPGINTIRKVLAQEKAKATRFRPM
ncbi:MAG: glycosyltransferase family 39 protein [Candidatus Eisenbacteria bacterium]